MLPESSETLNDVWGDVVPWGGFLCAFGFLLVRAVARIFHVQSLRGYVTLVLFRVSGSPFSVQYEGGIDAPSREVGCVPLGETRCWPMFETLVFSHGGQAVVSVAGMPNPLAFMWVI